jgi:hypothetical protein
MKKAIEVEKKENTHTRKCERETKPNKTKAMDRWQGHFELHIQIIR